MYKLMERGSPPGGRRELMLVVVLLMLMASCLLALSACGKEAFDYAGVWVDKGGGTLTIEHVKDAHWRSRAFSGRWVPLFEDDDHLANAEGTFVIDHVDRKLVVRLDGVPPATFIRKL